MSSSAGGYPAVFAPIRDLFFFLLQSQNGVYSLAWLLKHSTYEYAEGYQFNCGCGRGGGVYSPSYIGVCGPKGYGFNLFGCEF